MIDVRLLSVERGTGIEQAGQALVQSGEWKMAGIPFRGSLQDIRLFVAAYEEGSFTEAGRRENTAQSGVSQHIHNLEDAYGVRLFLREKSKIIPSPAADAIYGRCLVILRELGETAKDLRSFSTGETETIRVGLIPGLTRRLVAAALLKFEERQPNVKVRLLEGMSTRFPALVKSGEIDFALGIALGQDRAIRATPVISTPNCLIARHTEGDENAIMRAFPRGPLKICWPSGGTARRELLTARLLAAGATIEKEREIDSALATLDLVSRSDWVTVGPSVLLDPVLDAGRFSLRPIAADSSFDVALIENKSAVHNAAAATFLELLRGDIEKAVDAWTARFQDADV